MRARTLIERNDLCPCDTCMAATEGRERTELVLYRWISVGIDTLESYANSYTSDGLRR